MRSRSIIFSSMVFLAACGTTQTTPPPLRAMTPASHEPLFPIASGTHALGPDITCDACHGAFDTFSQFSCIACHSHLPELVDPFHFGVVSGYQYGAQTCYACHPRGEAAGFDHTLKFPIASGTVHQNLECKSCHTDPTNRKVFSCTSCHAATKTTSLASDINARHVVVQGYQWSSPACYACHPDSKVPLPTNVNHETKFPIAPPAKHQGISCATCHLDPTNRKVFSCLGSGCHPAATTNTLHPLTVVPAYKWESPSCYSCHPDSKVNLGTVMHTPFPITAGAKHQNLACLSCHPTPANKRLFDCTTCHTAAATNPTHTAVTGYSFTSPACLNCHPQSTVTSSVNHALYFPIAAGSKHAAASCASCHLDTTPPIDRTILGCASSCHPTATMTTRHTMVGGYSYSSRLCLRCHADSQVNRIAVHQPFRVVQPFKHYRRACLSCHPASRSDKPFGADFVKPKVSCLGSGCHNNPHHRTGSNFTTCLVAGCHPDGMKP